MSVCLHQSGEVSLCRDNILVEELHCYSLRNFYISQEVSRCESKIELLCYASDTAVGLLAPNMHTKDIALERSLPCRVDQVLRSIPQPLTQLEIGTSVVIEPGVCHADRRAGPSGRSGAAVPFHQPA